MLNFLAKNKIAELELDLVNSVKIVIKGIIIKGTTEAFYDSLVLGKFICCLAREKRLIPLFGELNCSFLNGYTVYPQKLPSCPAPCDSAPPPPESLLDS